MLVFVLCMLAISGCFGYQSRYMLCFNSALYLVGDSSADYIDVSKVNCERYNESHAVMYGELEFLKDMDGLILEIILKKEASGKHEAVFSHDICDLCAELGNADGSYQKYIKYLLLPKHCPFDAGSYKIEDLIVDVEEFEIKDTQCGSYLAELFMYKSTGDSCKNDRELLFTIKLDFSIEREG